MNGEENVCSSDNSSVISGDISRLNLTDNDQQRDGNNLQSVNVEHKQAWDNSVIIKDFLDMTDDGAADDFPFFLKEIDISAEILKTDPNRIADVAVHATLVKSSETVGEVVSTEDLAKSKISRSSKANISHLDEKDASKSLLETGEVKTTNKSSPVLNKHKDSDAKVSASTARSISLKKNLSVKRESDATQLETDKIKSSPVLNKHKDSDIKSNAVENTAQSGTQRKNFSFKRESTDGSTVTMTNSVNSESTSHSRESSAGEGYASNIRVVVRVRPLSLMEKQRGDKQCTKISGVGGLQVEGGNSQSKGFTFNSVLNVDSSQQHVFQESGIQNLIDKALDGFSCTVFAFGPTGSGKTHTIIGPSELRIEDTLDHQEVCGLVVRSFGYLFETTGKRSNVQYIIKASFLEVYNEKVKDLLNPSNSYDSLPVRWSSKKGFYVENLFCVECETSQDLMTLLVEGSNYRQVGVHAINEHSSRSHTMFTVYLESEEIDSDDDEGFPLIRHGKISFVDLAGSERVKETKTTVDAIAESNNINKSLLALGNCISALGDPKKRGYHIPYRDSKLTKLLADSLGGEGFTLMIACISPSSQNYQDTMNALRYANRAKDIKNKPMVKMDPKEQLLHRMKREIKLLRTENNYFRQQQGVPCSESQVIITPNDIDGELTPNSSGLLSPAIGSGTLSSLNLSRDNSSKELNLTNQSALYALGGKNGIYDILQEYMNENENLKAENMELHRSRALAHRQQEEMSRENERLTRKLEELGRVMLASPISRENIRLWINEGNDGSEIFSPSTAETSSTANGKSSVKFPPVRKGSYPNYVTVDLSQDVEYSKEKLYAYKDKDKGKSVLENKESKPNIEQSIVTQKSKEENAGQGVKLTTAEKFNSDQSLQSNANARANVKQNKKAINKSSNKNISGEQNEKGDGNPINKNKENTEDKKENSEKQIYNKNDSKVKKNFHPRPWKAKKKPTTVEKPSGYAAQFAARKGHQVPRQRTESDIVPSVDGNNNNMQVYQPVQTGSVLFSTQPSPYSYMPDHTPYMNTPLYNFSASYPYPYMGQLHGLPVNVYENMTNRLQQDLESLNGQLRPGMSYNNTHKQPPQHR